MGEGAAIFLLKRLADAERDGDKIYAVLRGMGGSSDGKGKGITAPNPVGQKFAVERAWENAGLSPGTVTLIEGHGTSTAVGDVVEAQSMIDVLGSSHLPAHSVALGSVKSNFGHLKGAAGAAGLLKATLALRDKVLPPSVHCEHLNPNIDFAHSPLYVNTELKTVDHASRWRAPRRSERFWFWRHQFPRRARRIHSGQAERKRQAIGGGQRHTVDCEGANAHAHDNDECGKCFPHVFSGHCFSGTASSPSYKAPLRGALVIGAASEAALVERLRAVEKGCESRPCPGANCSG